MSGRGVRLRGTSQKILLVAVLAIAFLLYYFYGVSGVIVGVGIGLISALSFNEKIVAVFAAEILLSGFSFSSQSATGGVASINLNLASSGFLLNLFLGITFVVLAGFLFGAVPNIRRK